jgi:hypothetical protein
MRITSATLIAGTVYDIAAAIAVVCGAFCVAFTIRAIIMRALAAIACPVATTVVPVKVTARGAFIIVTMGATATVALTGIYITYTVIGIRVDLTSFLIPTMGILCTFDTCILAAVDFFAIFLFPAMGIFGAVDTDTGYIGDCDTMLFCVAGIGPFIISAVSGETVRVGCIDGTVEIVVCFIVAPARHQGFVTTLTGAFDPVVIDIVGTAFGATIFTGAATRGRAFDTGGKSRIV